MANFPDIFRLTVATTGVLANSGAGWIASREPKRRLVQSVATMGADVRLGKSHPARKRTYNTRLIKRDYAYFISEIADLFHIHRNAVRRWIKAGLVTVDDRKPVLVHGGDLIGFLATRQSQRKQKCAADEFYCCRCRRPRHPLFHRVEVQIRNEARLNLSGVCDTCGARMNRVGLVARIEAFITQTPCEGRISGRSDALVMCHLDEDKIDAELQPQK